jgi:hypothetical protein
MRYWLAVERTIRKHNLEDKRVLSFPNNLWWLWSNFIRQIEVLAHFKKT